MVNDKKDHRKKLRINLQYQITWFKYNTSQE